MQEYYDLLGVVRDVKIDDLTKAYRRQAMKWHPDRNIGNEAVAEARFKRIKQAYDYLLKHHNQSGFGSHSSYRHQDSPPPRQDPPKPPPKPQGAHIYCKATVSLETAMRGGSINIIFHKVEQCTDCHGDGVRRGLFDCPKCKGTGTTATGRQCRTCHGGGAVLEKKCTTCKGAGLLKRKKVVSVTVPAGTIGGDNLRLRNLGEPSKDGGENGHVYCEIKIGKDSHYTVSKLNVTMDLHVDFVTALLGGQTSVEFFGKKYLVEIPSACRAGRTLSLEGAGLRNRRTGEVGKLRLRVVLDMPERARKLSKFQKEQFRTMFSTN